ncbi:hypothetical protein FJZ19_05950 [Candidatus Pacearchaeota archaeon]|nr:hypothetical protein [Candidatus Pacearchaeota archaeon]
MGEKTIVRLEEYVNKLEGDAKEACRKIFFISTDEAKLSIPDDFRAKAYKYFKQGNETVEETLARIKRQTIVRTFDRYYRQGAVFNGLRCYKPGNSQEGKEDNKKPIDKADRCVERDLVGGWDFQQPEKYTSADEDGERTRKNKSKSAINAASYDAHNGIVIPSQGNPYKLTKDEFFDSLDVAAEWLQKVYKKHPEAVFPIIGWNALPKAGASQVPNHMHVLTTKGMAYDDIDNLREAARRYKQDCEGKRDYFDDLFLIHEALELGCQREKCRVIGSITPKKDKEVWILGKSLDELKQPTYDILRCLIENEGVLSFNLAIQMPPLDDLPDWRGFPYIARIVDRGNPIKDLDLKVYKDLEKDSWILTILNPGTDIGFMEFYAAAVIGSDQHRVIRTLKRAC